ncbi:hypothetical protein K9N68_38695 (plasmid) [Kovacikia minuta CCNUW1]|uniref:hypothetical protein n=1 Tax=Kovacikia minuta TaxID=2931930 RepID=UPI001CCF5362|nr:hypothetical protein [Kovacikia minuta]UBF30110.1 hypothetical protein K9N68_38695 [Kovacikia minuta CCNUW1]
MQNAATIQQLQIGISTESTQAKPDPCGYSQIEAVVIIVVIRSNYSTVRTRPIQGTDIKGSSGCIPRVINL